MWSHKISNHMTFLHMPVSGITMAKSIIFFIENIHKHKHFLNNIYL